MIPGCSDVFDPTSKITATPVFDDPFGFFGWITVGIECWMQLMLGAWFVHFHSNGRICTQPWLYLSSDCTNPSQLPLPVNLSTTRSWSSSSIASSGYRQRVVLIQCILWLNSQDCFLHKLQPGLATVSQLYSYCTGMIGMVAVRPSAGSVGFVAQPDSTIAVINAKISP